MEKRLKVVEGFIALRLDDSCLVSDLVIPTKYKLPNFENYKRDNFPRHHLVMLFQKMASHTHDDKLMIHYF